MSTINYINTTVLNDSLSTSSCSRVILNNINITPTTYITNICVIFDNCLTFIFTNDSLTNDHCMYNCIE